MRADFTGTDIVAARAQAGLSQAELADRLGVTQATISRWEVGTQAPTSSLRQKLTTFLDNVKSRHAAEQIIAHSPFIMALVRRDWSVAAVSPGLAISAGCDAETLRGLTLKDVATAEMEQISLILAERGFFDGQPGAYRLIARGVTTDRLPCTFDAISTPVSLDGEFVMFNQIRLIDEAEYTTLRQTHDLVTPLG